MAKITIDAIKELRAKTSSGMALCKEALVHADGDMVKATEYINERSDVISRLQDLTGAKIGLTKIAYEEADKDFEKTVALIKERGWDNASAGEIESAEGIIGSYVHGIDQKTVALVEVTSTTDFVANDKNFRDFVHELALQVAAMKAKHVSKDSISEEALAEITKMFEKEMEGEKKPKEILEKIMQGKLNKFYAGSCLLEQKWFKDESKTMQNLLDETVLKLGEPIKIRRILLWELGK